MSDAPSRREGSDPGRVDDPGAGPRPEGEHNKIGYRNVDEEAEHDEAGAQGGAAGRPRTSD